MKTRLLLSGLILMTLAMIGLRLADTAARLEPVHIVVRADETLAPVSPLLFGQNYGPWMNTTDVYVTLYQDAGVTLLRFPAGNWGDENDIFPNMVNDLAMLADALNAEVSVQARSWRKGTPEKAAELVRYCNVENDYGFRYWEVGNEPDLYARRANRSGDPVFDVDWYNARFREFAEAMKAVDPNIQIVGPVVTGGWRKRGTELVEGWIPAFFAANGDIVDVISWHWYPHGNELNDAEALATPVEIEEQVETIRAWWRDPEINPLGHERPVPPLFLSEYSVSWSSGTSRHLSGQVAALWDAEVVGRMAKLEVEMAAHFALQGTRWHGLIGMLEAPRPVYGVYRLYSHWGTTQVMVASSDEQMLPAFASLRDNENENENEDDGALAVIVINKHPTQAREATLTIEGFRSSGSARIWLQDEEHPTVEELPTITIAGTFPYTFPPYSVTLLILEPSPQSNWPLLAALGLLVVALAVLVMLRL